MKNIYIAAILLLVVGNAAAQNGYIRLTNDSVLIGYIKHVLSIKDNEHVLEFWRTKNDKSPRRFMRRDVLGYAIKKDTFRILKNFKPFDSEELFIHNLDAKVIESGRIELLRIANPYYKSPPPGSPAGNGVGGVAISVGIRLFKKSIENIPTIFILHTPRNNYMRGVPQAEKQFNEVVHDFFSDIAIESFEKENGPLKFSSLKKMVAYYNMKISAARK